MSVTEPRYHVGDWVNVKFGLFSTLGEIVEDRGQLGVDGRRLYRVHSDDIGDGSSDFEVPEDELEEADPPTDRNPILAATLEMVASGKRFVRIEPSKRPRKNRKVIFHFSDGTSESRSFHCEPEVFMRWWKETSAFLRNLADAFDPATTP